METPQCEGPATGSIAVAHAAVQQQMATLTVLCATPLTLAAFERRLFTMLFAIGRTATALFFAHAVARVGGVGACAHASVVATRVGRVPLVQPVDATGARPVARALALCR